MEIRSLHITYNAINVLFQNIPKALGSKTKSTVQAKAKKKPCKNNDAKKRW